jgi:hypothetical protein
MDILFSDPRDRRGTKQRSAMLSVLRGLGEGVDLDALVAKAQKDYDEANAALAAISGATARDSRGRPYFAGDDILITDLPSVATWHTADAESLNVENVIPAIFGAINMGSARYLDMADNAAFPVSERAAGWIIGRLLDKYGLDQVVRTINADEDTRAAFKGSARWWKDNGASDGIERLAEVAADKGGAAWGDGQYKWASKHGNQVGAAVRLLKVATKAREEAIKDATTKVTIAKSALDAALAAKGYTPQGGTDIPCVEGYVKDADGKCVKEEKSVLPWVLGGAAVLGLVLFLRRR